jgi:hypothetical protein
VVRTKMLQRFMLLTSLISAQASADQPDRFGADVIHAVGSIIDVTGPAAQRRLKRRGASSTIEAQRGEFLYPGDTLSIRGQNVEVNVLMKGASIAQPIDESSSPYTVRAAGISSLSDEVIGFFSAIRWPWARRNPIARSRTYTKGDDGSDFVALPLKPVAPLPSLFGSVFAIPNDADTLTFGWCGDAAYARDFRADSPNSVIADEGGIGRLTGLNASGADRVRILNRADGSFLEFVIKRVGWDAMPRPRWLKTSKPASAVERTAWGIWLLREGPPEYHAFALTLLDESKFDFPAAAQYFGAATDCPA